MKLFKPLICTLSVLIAFSALSNEEELQLPESSCETQLVFGPIPVRMPVVGPKPTSLDSTRNMAAHEIGSYFVEKVRRRLNTPHPDPRINQLRLKLQAQIRIPFLVLAQTEHPFESTDNIRVSSIQTSETNFFAIFERDLGGLFNHEMLTEYWIVDILVSSSGLEDLPPEESTPQNLYKTLLGNYFLLFSEDEIKSAPDWVQITARAVRNSKSPNAKKLEESFLDYKDDRKPDQEDFTPQAHLLMKDIHLAFRDVKIFRPQWETVFVPSLAEVHPSAPRTDPLPTYISGSAIPMVMKTLKKIQEELKSIQLALKKVENLARIGKLKEDDIIRAQTPLVTFIKGWDALRNEKEILASLLEELNPQSVDETTFQNLHNTYFAVEAVLTEFRDTYFGKSTSSFQKLVLSTAPYLNTLTPSGMEAYLRFLEARMKLVTANPETYHMGIAID